MAKFEVYLLGLKYAISFILITVILSGFIKNSITADITGRLKRKKGDLTSRIDHIPVFVKSTHRILAKSKSNAKGVFHLSWNDSDTTCSPFYFYCIVEKDTLLLAKIKTLDSDDADITFILPDHTKNSK